MNRREIGSVHGQRAGDSLDQLLQLLSRNDRRRHSARADKGPFTMETEDSSEKSNDEEDVEYVLLDFGSDARLPDEDCELQFEDLDSSNPKVRVDGQDYTGSYEDTHGSTLVFCRDMLANTLQKDMDGVVASSHHRRATGPVASLVCTTTKRLRLDGSG